MEAALTLGSGANVVLAEVIQPGLLVRGSLCGFWKFETCLSHKTLRATALFTCVFVEDSLCTGCYLSSELGTGQGAKHLSPYHLQAQHLLREAARNKWLCIS